MCLLAYEANTYLKRPDVSIPDKWVSPDGVVAQSRHSVKMFDDTVRKFVGVTSTYEDDVIFGHSKEFLGNTWLPLARPLESDLGLFSSAGVLIGTTHAATYNMGLSIKDTKLSELGPVVGEMATALAKFVDGLTSNWPWQGKSFFDYTNVRQVNSKDVRADRHYKKLFDPTISLGLRASLESFQASLGFIKEYLSADREPASQATIAKLQYITLRHTYSSLEKVRDNTFLRPTAQEFLREALDTPTRDSRIVRDDNTKLRNSLVHYGLRKIPLDSLSIDKPLLGLVEYFYPDVSFAEFAVIVDREVVRLVDVLGRWAGVRYR